MESNANADLAMEDVQTSQAAEVSFVYFKGVLIIRLM